MSKITVYQYVMLDPFQRRKARRWGTREEQFAEILEETATEVDASAVDSLGFTQLDFDPRSARPDTDRESGA